MGFGRLDRCQRFSTPIHPPGRIALERRPTTKSCIVFSSRLETVAPPEILCTKYGAPPPLLGTGSSNEHRNVSTSLSLFLLTLRCLPETTLRSVKPGIPFVYSYKSVSGRVSDSFSGGPMRLVVIRTDTRLPSGASTSPFRALEL